MKTVLVANTDWYLYNFRLSLAKFLRSNGYEVIFVSPPGGYSDRLQEAGFRWIQWNLGRKTLAPVGEYKALRQLYSIYRSEKPDYVHHFTMKPVLYGTLSARAAGVPGIVNCVTGLGFIWLSEDMKARLLRPFMIFLFWIILGAQNVRMIFENDGDRDFFVKARLSEPKKNYLIPGVGVDVEKFSYSPEPEGIPVILFPARMLWDKGVGVLIQTAKSLKKRLELRIVLVGRPDPGNPTSVDEVSLQKWAQEGIIEYWGWQEDMQKVYQESHIVVLPSFYEGLPTALLEAAASSRPIVASDIPGCRAVVRHGKNGFLVPKNDPEALGAAIEKLVSDKNLRMKMGHVGRQFILKNHTNAIINERTLGVYKTLS